MCTHTPESKQCLGKTNTIASPERKLRLSTKLLDVAVLSLTAAQSAGTYPYGGFLMSHVSTHTHYYWMCIHQSMVPLGQTQVNFFSCHLERQASISWLLCSSH